MSTTPTDREELKRQIAELDDAGRFHESAALKTRLSRPAEVPADPARDDRREELKTQIAALEAKGKFAQAAPLKTELSRLSSPC